MQGIYKIKNLINNHVYIGSTKNFYKRIIEHENLLNKKRHHSRYLQNAWNKYGNSVFIFGMLEITEDKDLINREQYYIDTLNPEYNMCPIAGSRLGSKQSSETKAKIKKNNAKYWLGKNLSETTKQKIGDSNRGNKHTQKTRNKISAATKGKNHPMFGRTHSENSKTMMANAKSKPIAQYTLDGNFLCNWISGKEVQNKTEMSQGNINKACLGKYKQAYGFIWKFIL